MYRKKDKMNIIKKIFRKIGIDLNQKYRCIKCKKPISTEQKRCPYCEAWNDCCSIDPRLLKK